MKRMLGWFADLLFGAPMEPSTNERMRAVMLADPLPKPTRTQDGDPERQRRGLKVRRPTVKIRRVIPMRGRKEHHG